MKFRVRHLTTYRYSGEFASCHNQVHLTPRDTERQTCLHSGLVVNPSPEVFDRHEDSFGNQVDSFSIHAPGDELRIEAVSEVDVFGVDAVKGGAEPWEEVRDLLMSREAPLDPLPFIFESSYVELSDPLAEYAKVSFTPGRPIHDSARDLTRRIFSEFTFDSKSTDVGTHVTEVLQRKRGVCQDFAHLMIGCVRALGLSSRYISGYLQTTADPSKPRLVGADVSHAWCSIWSPSAGWMEFDPTNDLAPCNRHITVAYGRDYGDISPVRGIVLGGGGHHVDVSVDVESLKEA